MYLHSLLKVFGYTNLVAFVWLVILQRITNIWLIIFGFILFTLIAVILHGSSDAAERAPK